MLSIYHYPSQRQPIYSRDRVQEGNIYAIFAIPELLEHLVRFIADPATLTKASRVCKPLSEAALDALWSDLKSVLPLIQLLGELTVKYSVGDTGGCSTLDFANPLITQQNWERYQKYSPRVKAIRLEFSHGLSVKGQIGRLSPSVFGAISLTRPQGLNLLPNARRIALCPTTDTTIFYLPFLSKTEHNLHLDVMIGGDSATFRYVMLELCLHAATIKSLRIETKLTVADFEDTMVTFLSRAIHLKDIRLPLYFFTTKIFDAASSLEFLGRMSTSSAYPFISVGPFQQLDGSRFINLRRLEISSILESLLPLFADSSWAPLLTEVQIASPDSSPLPLKDFGIIVGQYRPQLTSIYLDFQTHWEPHYTDTLIFQHLLGFLDCHLLQTFILDHIQTCIMNTQDLEQMLHHWPQLKKLSLPADIPALFPFDDTLNLFAQLCPDIESITLPFQDIGTLVCPPHLRLAKLQELDAGSAKVGNLDEVALYLISICDSDSILVCNSRSLWGREESEMQEWREVERLYRLLTRFKKRERRKIKEEGLAAPGWYVVNNPGPVSNNGEIDVPALE